MVTVFQGSPNHFIALLGIALALTITACSSEAERTAEGIDFCTEHGVDPGTTDMNYCASTYAGFLKTYERNQMTERLTALAAATDENQPSNPTPNLNNTPIVGPSGNTVYNYSQCIGAVVNGVCTGSIMPDSQYHPTCHGTMLNGQCTGPLF